MAKKQPRWYFSFRSPYSWFAYRELTEHHKDIAEAISWIPSWEPDEAGVRALAERGIELPYVAMSKDKHLYVLQDARRLSRARGLAMTWPIDRAPHWDVAHLSYFVADAEGKGREFIDAVYRARWEQGREISDPATMAELAVELGLDPVRVAGAVNDPEVREQGLAVLTAGYRDSVFGVPFFIQGYHKFWGIDRLDAFVTGLRAELTGKPETAAPQAPQEEAAQTALTAMAPAADAGHAGGCG